MYRKMCEPIALDIEKKAYFLGKQPILAKKKNKINQPFGALFLNKTYFENLSIR